MQADDDLVALGAQFDPARWGDDNGMAAFRPERLSTFLDAGGVLLVALDDDGDVAGDALCYLLPHPCGHDALYVHEVDVRPGHRRQGAATALMHEALRIARRAGAAEVFVLTEPDNVPARRLYAGLQPTEAGDSVTYVFAL